MCDLNNRLFASQKEESKNTIQMQRHLYKAD